MKKVHKDTLGWRAGVQDNDKIVQVSVCLCSYLGQQLRAGREGGREGLISVLKHCLSYLLFQSKALSNVM